MKRGKNNKAHLAASLLRKIYNVEKVVLANLEKPVRGSGKTRKSADNLSVLNHAKNYLYKTPIKRLDKGYIYAWQRLVQLVAGSYSYGKNIYHEEPSIENALIPKEHKEKLNGKD